MNEFQRKSVDRTLDVVVADMAEKGWSHLSTGIDPMDTTAIRGLFSAMSDRLTVDRSVKPEISVIAPREKSKVLASSSQGMSFHTDNVYLEDPCKSIALFCSVQAEEGGMNQLVDGLAIARELSEDVREALADPRWSWIHPATQEPSGEFSVLDEEQERLRWWRMSLLNEEMASIAIADAFEDAIINSAEERTVLMQPGDILVTNNMRILHNRSAFVGERRVYRTRFW